MKKGWWATPGDVFRGDTEWAIELLRLSVSSGMISPAWRAYLQLASQTLLEAEAFETFVKEYEAEERRLREL